MRWSLLLTLSIWASMPLAMETTSEPDFDSLGGNTILLERAKALEPEKQISIVQTRTVNRRNRIELAPELASTFGGDSYMRTRTLGINAGYHFNPRLSVSLKYNYAFNNLTDEGEAMVDRARADFEANPENPSSPYPDLDYVRDEAMALVNWYPLYGKLNLLNKAVAQFDLYTLAGAGQVRLRSGTTSTYTAGCGIGFWINRNLSTRFEVRYQNYTAQYLTGEKDMDLTIGSLQMGWML